MLTNTEVMDRQATIAATRATADTHYRAGEMARRNGDTRAAGRLADLGALADARADRAERDLAERLGAGVAQS